MSTLPNDIRAQANGLGQFTGRTEAELVLDEVRSLVSGAGIRKMTLRPFWEAYVNYLMTIHPPVPNTGSVFYIDPTGSAGAGTFASPANVFPGSPVANTTYLIKERTRVIGTTQFTGITATGLVIGTYDAGSGARVFEKDRLATIDGGSSNFRCAIRWQGTSGNFSLSGIRVIGGGTGSGGVQQFESLTAPATSLITVEHCVFEGVGPYALLGGQVNNQAVTCGGARFIGRFNRVCVEGDGFMLNPAATAGYQLIGNEVVVPPTLTVGGPDCVQIIRTSSNAVGKQHLVGNWLDQAANTKQAFVLSGGTPQATGEEMFCARNFFFGVDLLANPVLPPFSGGQIAFINDTLSPAVIVGNYFDQFAGWAGVSTNGVLMHNIGIREHAGQWYSGFGVSAGATGAVVANNTAIALDTTWVPGAANTGFEINGTGHTVKNNICVNLGLRMDLPTEETSTLFVGSLPVNFNNTTRPLGAGSKQAGDALLDSVGRPKAGSEALTGGTPVTVGGFTQRFADIFGTTAASTTAFNVGAAQGWQS